MLNRLYRTDMERLVMSYEMIRNALQREIDRRMMLAKEQALSHLQQPLPTKYVSKGMQNGLSATTNVPIETAIPVSPLSKSYSQPIQPPPSYYAFLSGHQPMPPPPVQFSSDANTRSQQPPQYQQQPAPGPIKSASQPVPSLSAIHSVQQNTSTPNLLPKSGSNPNSHQLHHHQHQQLPLGKTVSSTSMTSGHGSSILESSSSTSSLFSLSMSGSHPYLATSNSSIHSITSSSSSLAAPPPGVINGPPSGNQNGPVASGLVVNASAYASLSHLFSAEEETKV